MNLVYDRTIADVQAGTDKGKYQAADLNRVEAATAEVEEKLREAGEWHGAQTHKTNWALTNTFSTSTWPTESQMARYLGNIKALCLAFGFSPVLPDTMSGLTHEGANQIEKALYDLSVYIDNAKQAAPYCGAVYCGG